MLTKTKIRQQIRQGSYHFFVLLLFHCRHDESRDDSPLDIQDVDRLVILRVEFNIRLAFDCDLQGVPVDVERSAFTTCPLPLPHFHLLYFPIILSFRSKTTQMVNKAFLETKKVTYSAMAALKASAPAAGRYTRLPSASTPEISLREHSVVRRMKLQVWGTSTSTFAADQICFVSTGVFYYGS